MQKLSSRAGIGVAVTAAVMAILWSLFVPYGNPWMSVAWVFVACAAAVWAVRAARDPSPSMGDVIRGVEGEPGRVPAGPDPDVVSVTPPS